MVPENFPDRAVCIVGLGYVGLTLGAVMADTGFNVLGVEIRDDVVQMLNKGEPHFHEPGLANLLKRVIQQKRFQVAKRIPRNISSRVYFITVGTPLGKNGKIRTDMIENVAYEVAEHIRDGDLVILRSTVKLGLTRQLVLPILEKSEKHFDLAFCPERTVEGYAMTELRQLPQIVAGRDLHSSVRAAQLFQFITPSVVQVSDIETAEMIKLVDNSHRDVYLAYGNEVARMCDAIGISAAEVIFAGKMGYHRTNVYLPGPVGGPCLEKDPHILAESLEQFGVIPEISRSARLVNERQPKEIIAKIADVVKQLPAFLDKPVISLLGIAFKGRPETDDLRGTMAMPIFEEIKKQFPNATFRGFDSVVASETVRKFGLVSCKNLEEAFTGASLVLILNNHPLFGKMPIAGLSELLKRPALIYDFWNNFFSQELVLPASVWYMALGSHGKTKLPPGRTSVRLNQLVRPEGAPLSYDQKISRDRRHRFHRIGSRKTASKRGQLRARARQ